MNNNQIKIIIDADACPKAVLKICLEQGRRFNVPVYTVASFRHNIESDHHITVGDNAEETDLKIMNLTKPWDIAVTQDFGLAAMLLGRGARCLNPKGHEYNRETIAFLLEERAASARHRRSGGRTKGPKKRTADCDERFSQTLESILRQTIGEQE
jgi:uncharacterized protein